jgi:hypothetical protein
MNTIAPSRPDYWRGTQSGSGRLTVEQLNAVRTGQLAGQIALFRRRGGMDTVEIRKLAHSGAVDAIPREVRFTCPVVALTKDKKRACVITPCGLTSWEDLR